MTTVPRLWPDSTIVCLGSGPSLTQTDVDWCRGKVRVVGVNDAYRLAPFADVLYSADAKWWRWQKGAPTFPGLKYSVSADAARWPGVQVLRHTGKDGLERDPTAVRTGFNSGYQAINLAVHLGATRILLLGYDFRTMGAKDHFFGQHRDGTKPPFAACLRAFPTLVEPLQALGITVINCSPNSALRCFPQQPLAEVLAAREAVA